MSFKKLILSLFMISISTNALAQHALIDRMRPSGSNVFVSSAIEGEYGKFSKSRGEDLPVERSGWRGYGVRNGVGVEVLKFAQFSLSHTMLSLRSNSSSLENARGSRLAADMTFSFSAPITNIQFGLGVLASQLDYQDREYSASLLGSGYYQSMGFNYFVSPSISCLLLGKRLTSQNTGNSGSELSSLDSTTDNISFGISIWM